MGRSMRFDFPSRARRTVVRREPAKNSRQKLRFATRSAKLKDVAGEGGVADLGLMDRALLLRGA